MEIKNGFSQRLKELRVENGLSQKELSIKLNKQITQSAVGLWELGKRVPNLDAVILLADFFGVSLDYMAGRED